MQTFEDNRLSHELRLAIKRLGFTEPTQIQREAIPPTLEGKDVIGESATGSGKTLVFGCRVVESVIPKAGLQAIILTPTRELAEQIKESLRTFAYHKSLTIISVYGGVSMSAQLHDLPRSEVVVGTPGRMMDHLRRGTLRTDRVKLLVLDEADRMLDMGFIKDVEQLIRACPRDRQTLFFSATISSDINALAHKYMRSPVKVSAKTHVDPEKLKQVYYNIQKNVKLSLLIHLLQQEKTSLAMVFCNTRRTTDFVVKNLKANKIESIAIHGGLAQNKRTKMLDLFHQAKVQVLVCTDVAARGLHISNVSHVYNYEIPKDPKDYVHRIGRTARAGEEGKVVNLLSEQDHENFGRIQRDYRNFHIQKLEKPFLNKVVILRDEPRSFEREFPRRNFPRRGFSGRRWEKRDYQSSEQGSRFGQRSSEGERNSRFHSGERSDHRTH